MTQELPNDVRLKDLRKLGKLKKIPEILRFHGKYPAAHPKAKFWWFFVKYLKLSAVKRFIEKPSFFSIQKPSLILRVCLQSFVQDCDSVASHDLCDHVIICQHAMSPQWVVLMPLFSVSLPLPLKVYTLLV